MAWDFSTEIEFQHQLDWIRDFVDNEIIPIELIQGGLNQTQLDQLWALKDKLKRKISGPHLGPEHGGQGMGQLKLANPRNTRS